MGTADGVASAECTITATANDDVGAEGACGRFGDGIMEGVSGLAELPLDAAPLARA